MFPNMEANHLYRWLPGDGLYIRCMGYTKVGRLLLFLILGGPNKSRYPIYDIHR